jgi:hypothetical protein
MLRFKQNMAELGVWGKLAVIGTGMMFVGKAIRATFVGSTVGMTVIYIGMMLGVLATPGLVYVYLRRMKSGGDVVRAESDTACAQCGYDLTGNVSQICPECGTRIEGNYIGVLRSRTDPRERWPSVLGIIVSLFGVGGSVFMILSDSRTIENLGLLTVIFSCVLLFTSAMECIGTK